MSYAILSLISSFSIIYSLIADNYKEVSILTNQSDHFDPHSTDYSRVLYGILFLAIKLFFDMNG
jgi:hypothetical protein